jgi:hypothetical protein
LVLLFGGAAIIVYHKCSGVMQLESRNKKEQQFKKLR